MISAQAAQIAGLKPTKPTPKGWPADMFLTALPALKIGDATFKDVQFMAMDFLAGKTVTAQVDTMYTGSLLVYTASIEKLSLSEAAKTTETQRFVLTDGGVNMKVAAAKQESFHGLKLGGAHLKVYFPTEGVHEPDGLFDATVGLELFQNIIVTFDLHGMNLILRKGQPKM